jgi:alpha-L-glutamate ligase-like protein
MGLLPGKQFSSVLGMNARTIEYTRRVNRASAVRRANNKLSTKRALQKAGVPTPRLFVKISSRHELRRFRWTKLPSSFVLKPNASSGGAGITVVFGRNKKGRWVKADKSEIFIPELQRQVMDIIDGNFSANNVADTAIFEQRVRLDAILKPYSVRGVPDIRVLVYNMVPIMAMLRLPTLDSGGRANLHQGGIGVGIDVAYGYTTTAIHRGRIIDTLPSKRLQLSSIRLPQWNNILLTAVRAARAVGLNYAGIDVAIDREDGPLVLEVNALPGLDIQFANLTPLKGRLRRVEGLKVSAAEKGVQLAKSLFGEEYREEVEDISGRIVLGIEEPITITDIDGQSRTLLAKIDTGAYRSTIDENLARQYGLHKTVIGHKNVRATLGAETRPVIEVTIKLRDRIIKTKAFMADRAHMSYDAILGRRDLRGFLVDPTKRKHGNSKYL